MACLNPPLLKKPSKGFAWQCAFCTRQELVSTEEEEKPAAPPQKEKRSTRSTRSQSSTKSSPALEKPTEISETSIKLKINQPKKITTSGGGYKSKSFLPLQNGNFKQLFIIDQQIKMTHMWPFRYFGVNTNIRDILGKSPPRIENQISLLILYRCG